MSWDWNLIAEVLGFGSGCALLWPAISQNASLRKIARLLETLRKSKGRLGKRTAGKESVKLANQPSWSLVDQWLLTTGTLLLLASFALKISVLLKWLPS